MHGWTQRRLLGIAVTALLVSFTSPLGAQTFTWDGEGGDSNWTTDANWDNGDTRPPYAVGGDLVFDGSANLNPVADVDDPEENWRDIGELSFAATADTFVISGESLTFDTNGGIVNESSETQGVFNDINVTGGSFLLDAGPGALVIGDEADPGAFDLADSATLNVETDDASPSPGAAQVTIHHEVTGDDATVNLGENLTLRLTAANSYSGETVLNTGSALWIENEDGAGESEIHVDGEATLFADGEFDLDNDITLNDTLLLSTGGDTNSLTGTITGTGGLELDANTHIVITGDNDYEGGTTLGDVSQITVGSDTALGSGDLIVSDDATAVLNGVLFEDEEEDDIEARTLGNNVQIGTDALLGVTGDAPLVLEGDISGDGILAVEDEGFLTLTGENTHAGGTELYGESVLIAGSDTALGAGDLTVGSEATATLAALIDEDEEIDARTLANDITINTDATLWIAGEHDMALEGLISGDGLLSVDLDQDSTVTLEQANVHTGGTTLRSGTTEIGSDTAFGTGDITVDGLAAVSGIAGEGARELDYLIHINEAPDEQSSSSWLTVAGEEDFTFANTSGDDGLQGGGILRLGQDDATVTLVDNHDAFEGTVQVVEGSTLDLQGTIGGDVLSGVTESDIEQGGIITGVGTVTGDLTAFANSTIRPGNSIGTMTVGEDFTVSDNATLEVEINITDGTADLISVGGDVLLDENSTIDVSQVDGENLSSDDVFTIIEADGTIEDEGANVIFETSNALRALAGQIIEDSGMQFYQLVTSGDVFQLDAVGPNNLAVASALNQLNTNDADPDVVDFLESIAEIEDPAEYNQALEQVSPEGYQSLDSVNVQNARLYTTNLRSYLSARRQGGPIMAGLQMSQRSSGGISTASASHEEVTLSISLAQAEETEAEEADPTQAAPAAEQRRRAVPRRVAGRRVGRTQGGGFGEDGKWGVFGQAVGGHHDIDSDSYRSGYRANVIGGQAGIDRNIDDQLTIGLGFSYANSDVNLKRGRGELDVDSVRGGPYLGWTDANNRLFVDSSLTFGYHDVDSDRYVASQDATASAGYDGYDVLAYAGTGYPFYFGELTITPRASLQYLFLHQGGFTESGAGPANLQVDGRDSHSLRTQLGGSIGTYFHAADMIILPELFIGWEHEALDDDDLTARFVAGGDAFSITPTTPGRNAAALGASVNLLINENVSGFVRYEGRLSGDGNAHGFGGGLTFRF